MWKATAFRRREPTKEGVMIIRGDHPNTKDPLMEEDTLMEVEDPLIEEDTLAEDPLMEEEDPLDPHMTRTTKP